MDSQTMFTIGLVVGTLAGLWILYAQFGGRSKKEDPLGAPQRVVHHATPLPDPEPMPAKLDPEKLEQAMNAMYYHGLKFGKTLSERNRAVRRDRKQIASVAGRDCERSRTKVRRELGL